MSSSCVLPLLSLHNDEQMMIMSKMNNSEITRMAATCLEIKNLVETYPRTHSSRSAYGDNMNILASKTNICINKSVVEEMTEGFVADSNAVQKLRSLAIFKLKIVIVDRIATINLMKLLKNWRPICREADICGSIPSESLFALVDNVKTKKFRIFHHSDDNKFAVNMKMLRKTRNINVIDILNGNLTINGGIEDLSNLNEISVSTNVESSNRFFLELSKTKNPGNLTHIAFYCPIPDPMLSDSFPYLSPNTPSPATTVLFTTRVTILTREKNIVSIRKLPLGNKKCVLIEEGILRHQEGINIYVHARIMNDDEEEILDKLIEILEIKVGFFKKEGRIRYFAKNEKNRLNYIGMVKFWS